MSCIFQNSSKYIKIQNYYFLNFSIKKFKSGTSTTNLSQHLVDNHKITKKDLAPATTSKKLTDYFGLSQGTSSQTSIDKGYLLSRRLALLCCRSLISFNSVSSDSEGFTDFLKSYGIVIDKGPHRTTISRCALTDLFHEMIPIVKNIVQKPRYCSITTDLWTDNYRRKGYITFNFCCIMDTFELKNINLKTGIMSSRHTAVEIGIEFRRTLAYFGIENTSFYLVSDKGSNMVKLIEDENLDHQFCLGHGLHNLVTVDGFKAVEEVDELLTKVKKVVRKLRFRSVELENEVSKMKMRI